MARNFDPEIRQSNTLHDMVMQELQRRRDFYGTRWPTNDEMIADGFIPDPDAEYDDDDDLAGIECVTCPHCGGSVEL